MIRCVNDPFYYCTRPLASMQVVSSTPIRDPRTNEWVSQPTGFACDEDPIWCDFKRSLDEMLPEVRA
jgi:hypothetical protein